VSLFFDYTWTQSWSEFLALRSFFIDDRSGWRRAAQARRLLEDPGRRHDVHDRLDTSYEMANSWSCSSRGRATGPSIAAGMIGAYENVEVRPIKELILSGGARVDRAILDLDQDQQFGATFERKRSFDQVSPMAGVTVKPSRSCRSTAPTAVPSSIPRETS
jgi:hypothetical protein